MGLFGGPFDFVKKIVVLIDGGYLRVASTAHKGCQTFKYNPDFRQSRIAASLMVDSIQTEVTSR